MSLLLSGFEVVKKTTEEEEWTVSQGQGVLGHVFPMLEFSFSIHRN